MYYKSSTMSHMVRQGMRGRRNGEVYHRRNGGQTAPLRKPLDKCEAALWRVVSINLERIFCKFEKPWVSPDGKIVKSRMIVRHVIILEHFRGQTLRFVVNKDTVRDMRDDSTMTHDEFEKFVSDRIKEPFTCP